MLPQAKVYERKPYIAVQMYRSIGVRQLCCGHKPAWLPHSKARGSIALLAAIGCRAAPQSAAGLHIFDRSS
jgi:hypothetical protein